MTEAHLRANGVPFGRTLDGMVVPAEAALGTAVAFRAADAVV
ncbi:hypothetical protein [Nocardiopsis oceani]